MLKPVCQSHNLRNDGSDNVPPTNPFRKMNTSSVGGRWAIRLIHSTESASEGDVDIVSGLIGVDEEYRERIAMYEFTQTLYQCRIAWIKI